jgi:hypothetical protein
VSAACLMPRPERRQPAEYFCFPVPCAPQALQPDAEALALQLLDESDLIKQHCAQDPQVMAAAHSLARPLTAGPLLPWFAVRAHGCTLAQGSSRCMRWRLRTPAAVSVLVLLHMPVWHIACCELSSHKQMVDMYTYYACRPLTKSLWRCGTSPHTCSTPRSSPGPSVRGEGGIALLCVRGRHGVSLRCNPAPAKTALLAHWSAAFRQRA